MAGAEKQIPASLEEAVAELKRDPHRPVHARVDNLDVEIRVLETRAVAGADLGDRMAAAGPWQGETEDEILEILREARCLGSSEAAATTPRSFIGLCPDLGPAPSAEEIDEARREMWAGFPRDDI